MSDEHRIDRVDAPDFAGATCSCGWRAAGSFPQHRRMVDDEVASHLIDNGVMPPDLNKVPAIGGSRFFTTWTPEQYQTWGDKAGHPRPPTYWMPELTTEKDPVTENELRKGHWRTPLGISIDLGYVLRIRGEAPADQAAADAALRSAIWYTGQAADYAKRETEVPA
jgi:hypothetical protein